MDPVQPQPKVAKWLWITLTIVAVIAGAFFAWYFLMGPGKTVETKTTTPVTTDVTANWKTYTNTQYAYSIKYPETYTVKQDAKDLDSAKDLTKAALVDFLSGTTNKMTVTAVSKSRFTGSTLTSFAATYPTPKDKLTISGGKTTKIGTLTGYQELVTITDPASSGLWYFAESTKYYYVFTTIEKVQSSTTKNMLANFKLTATTTTTPATTEPTPTTNTDTSWKNYTNSDYGFKLTFTDAWKGYKVKKVALEGTVANYYINMPTTDPFYKDETEMSYAGYAAPFVIGVMDKAGWTGDEMQVKDFGSKIGENAQYVFTGSSWQAGPDDLLSSLGSSISAIIASFQI